MVALSRTVKRSTELQRIARLPRRVDEPSGDVQLAAEMTRLLRTPGGQWELRPIQAVALATVHQMRGYLGPVRVGGGKTLISLLAPTVLCVERPLLVIPAGMRRDLQIAFEELRQHWLIREPRIATYEGLGRVNQAHMLETYQPDMIICDEAHYLKNPRAAVTRRFRRYMTEHPDTVFIGMSGTLTKRSLRDYAHLAEWALGREFSPLPTVWGVLEEWADALDVGVAESRRHAPGALRELYDEGDRQLPELAAARRAFRRRLTQSPGVVATGDVQVPAELCIRAVEPTYSSATEEAFRTLTSSWETPDGWPISDGATLWRHARELACGFYYVWNPRPPTNWLDARKAWAKECRAILKHNHKNLDSELQVINALDREEIVRPTARTALGAWREIKTTFVPNTEARWLDAAALALAAQWMEQGPGIVWCEHVVFGEMLSELTGYRYYGQQGRAKDGSLLIQARGPVIASVGANHRGRNLQHWHRSLVISAPPSGAVWEQLLGRTHRDGQRAHVVTYYVMCGCVQVWSGFVKAIEDARYMQDSLGQNQKLLYSDLDWPSADEIANRTGARWK